MPEHPDDEQLRDSLTRLGTVLDFLKRDIEEMRTRLRDEFVSAKEGDHFRDEIAKFDRLLAAFDARVAALISKFETEFWRRIDAFKQDHVTKDVFEPTKKAVELCATRAEVDAIVKQLAKMEETAKTYVTKTEHAPVKNIAFGAVGVIVMAVLGALVALVVRGGTA